MNNPIDVEQLVYDLLKKLDQLSDEVHDNNTLIRDLINKINEFVEYHREYERKIHTLYIKIIKLCIIIISLLSGCEAVKFLIK